MGFNAAQRATQVPACEQTNRAVVERAMENDLEYPAVVKQLEGEMVSVFQSSMAMFISHFVTSNNDGIKYTPLTLTIDIFISIYIASTNKIITSQ